MNPLEEACFDYCKQRWMNLTEQTKNLLELNKPEVAAFTVILWSMQFYREHASIAFDLREMQGGKR